MKTKEVATMITRKNGRTYTIEEMVASALSPRLPERNSSERKLIRQIFGREARAIVKADIAANVKEIKDAQMIVLIDASILGMDDVPVENIPEDETEYRALRRKQTLKYLRRFLKFFETMDSKYLNITDPVDTFDAKIFDDIIYLAWIRLVHQPNIIPSNAKDLVCEELDALIYYTKRAEKFNFYYEW